MTGRRVGYIRVSSFDQNPERQLEGIKVDRIFTDKASGKDIKRPQLEALMSFVRTGDTVVVHSMDRLARNLDDLRRIVQTLTQHGVHIGFTKEPLRFTGEDSPMANLMLSVMGAFAGFERSLDPRTPARRHRFGQTAWCLSRSQKISIRPANCRIAPASCCR